jgi:NDP-sugar pyrophosphorylase family protein
MKERITITLDSELINQIDKRIDGNIIKNRSQQIELLLTKALGTYRPEKAVILVGGKGKEPIKTKIPNCMLEIQGRTVLEHIFDLLKKYGIRDVILCVGRMKDKVKGYYEDGSKFGVNITYVEEDKPLGTAGCLRTLRSQLKDSFIVANSDELKNINLPRMFRLHKRKDALATIALTTVRDPSQYGVTRLSGSRILQYIEKPADEEASNLINAGFYILEPDVIGMIPEGYATLEKDIFPKLAQQGRLRGFPFAGQWFDIEDAERYERAKNKWKGVSPYGEDE